MDSDSSEGLTDGFLMRFEETTGASEPAGMRMDSDSSEGFLGGFLMFSELGAGTSRPAGMKIDSDSGEGLMEDSTPGVQSAAPGAAGSAEPAAPGAAGCNFSLDFFAGVDASGACGPA